MVNARDFFSEFLKIGLNHFTGVPDSTLKEWIVLLEDNQGIFENRIAANEGAAIAHASGYYLATNKVSVVYLQNSGLGNCISPLTSLTDSDVYGIPLVMVMGWRGKPGLKDEPQHKKMGAVTCKILDTLDIHYEVITSNNYVSQIHKAKLWAEKNLAPFVLIIEPGFFKKTPAKTNKLVKLGLNRESAISCIVNTIKNDDIIISTTGKTSRELYEICCTHIRGHKRNFYNVGSMGHVNAIGLEVALKSKNSVYILDGDGAIIMHMGSLATIGYYQPQNLTHIIFDNKSHESTGGQPTVSASLDIPKILSGCNYKNVSYIQSEKDLFNILNKNQNGLKGMVIETKNESRADLGRPEDSPQKTKVRFMESFVNEK